MPYSPCPLWPEGDVPATRRILIEIIGLAEELQIFQVLLVERAPCPLSKLRLRRREADRFGRTRPDKPCEAEKHPENGKNGPCASRLLQSRSLVIPIVIVLFHASLHSAGGPDGATVAIPLVGVCGEAHISAIKSRHLASPAHWPPKAL